jgi:hypothetical protein
MKTFELRNIFKLSEEDNYEEGCLPQTAQDSMIAGPIAGDSLAELLKRFADMVGGDVSDIVINPCDDDPSRIELQTTENADGYAPTAQENADFAAGKINLYAVTYTAYVEEVIRTPLTF